MALDRDLEHFLAQERREDAERVQRHDREACRQRGVAWSALGPEPFASRSPQAQRRAALHRLQAYRQWRSSSAGRLLRALSEAQQAAERAHALAETARAAVARNDGRVSVPLDLERHALALLAAVRRARCATDP
jgi:hypothetical protein